MFLYLQHFTASAVVAVASAVVAVASAVVVVVVNLSMVSYKVIVFIVQCWFFPLEWRGNVYFKPTNEFLLLHFFFFFLITGTRL